MSWTDERVAYLRSLVADGLSSGQVAKEFGGGLSRNAVLGKAKRLKLEWFNRRGPSEAPHKPLARTKMRPWPRATHTPDPPTDAPKAISAAPNSKPVDLMELTNETCRFPLWGDAPGEPRLFCGALEADNAAGIVYCPLHARAVTNHGRGRDDTVEGVAR